jgi:Immunity protein 31
LDWTAEAFVATEARFNFYEKVVIKSTDPAKAEINGRIGAVLGRVCGDDGIWSYAISMYYSGICWYCWDDELQATGESDRYESFFDGSSVRVSQSGDLLS